MNPVNERADAVSASPTIGVRNSCQVVSSLQREKGLTTAPSVALWLKTGENHESHEPQRFREWYHSSDS